MHIAYSTISGTMSGSFNPTSPHSSSGVADSFKGTPDTRLTAFSPEDGSTKSARAPLSMSVGRRESGPVKFNVASPASLNIPTRSSFFRGSHNADRDPFVSSSNTRFQGTRLGQGLSPTASCFSPLSGATDTRAVEPTFTYQGVGSNSKAEEDTSQVIVRASSTFVHSTLSTDLGISRCVVVAAGSGRVQIIDTEQYISSLAQRGFQFQGSTHFGASGDKVYVRFSNIRDACLFSQNVHVGGQDWRINYIHPREYSQVVDPTSGLITAHEGQLTLAVFGPPTLQSVDANQLQSFLHSVLLSQGDLFAFKVQAHGVEGSLLSAIVEYCDNDVSLRAVSELSGKVVDGFQTCMTLHRPDIPTMATLAHDRIVSPARTVTSSSDFTNDFQRLSLTRPQSSVSSMTGSFLSTPTRHSYASSYHVQPSYGMMPVVYHGMPMTPPYMLDPAFQRNSNAMFPAGNYSWAGPAYHHQSSVMSPEYMTPRQFAYPRHDSRRQNAMRVHRSPYHHHNVSGQHNHVDVNRIREGIDVRTTIMLRNIPNKVDQAMLKRIVDESSWAKYDFMYLRIDFANDCNVGYAFINFVDPLDIIDFVNKRGNQRWNCFKSDKVAEISYATIQGKDCLVQKFRNSSLYYTSNGPVPEHSGHEEPFPEPDNQSKMKRSCENAEHVGLFTPNAGQHLRDEQRRRRSQYDRGTRLAALEEYDYDPSFHQHHPHHHYPPQ
ncbi:RNA recognition motif 2-domain-containing protein [Xylariales sp. AK1849]|nr:RNA recognition motif 2-domain-containing protein [Xylariales sp. AK1849]